MVRQQIGVFSQAVRCAFDLHDDRVVQQPVEQRRGHHAVAEHVTPFTRRQIKKLGKITSTKVGSIYPTLTLLLEQPTAKRLARDAGNPTAINE